MGRFEVMLFDVADSLEYFVESAGVRSPQFTLSVLDLPYVERLDLEYVFPDHSGLPPESVEDGGDIAALIGTEVHLRAFLTMPADGGRIVLDEEGSIVLTSEPDGSLTGQFTVEHDGFYRIDLDMPEGDPITASPQFTIDALADRMPSVSFSRPRRDLDASALEEVFVEAEAEDDFGVRDLELVYSVNGATDQTVSLYDGSGSPAREVSAGHTFYLEELGLRPGDFVSYHARVRDNDMAGGTKTATSDLYFVRIRPFDREFREAQSQAQGGGGGAAGNASALSEQQRQIVTGTFNLSRDSDSMTSERVRESAVVLALSQERLQEEVQELASRMQERLVSAQPEFREIADLLPQAAEEMAAATERLHARDFDDALAPEQRALRLLQQAEEAYDAQVSITRNNGGGGGGGSAGLSEELADLFEMELDQLANQYETRQSAQQQQGSQQLDELAEQLRELARRQEQEAERERRRTAAGQASQGGGANQRALAEQAEETARQLERLAREEARPELSEAARRLQEAADEMRRAAAGGRAGGAGQASAALERLREAQEQLTRDRQGRAEDDLAEALREAEDLTETQEEIAAGSTGLRNNDRGELQGQPGAGVEVSTAEGSPRGTGGEFGAAARPPGCRTETRSDRVVSEARRGRRLDS